MACKVEIGKTINNSIAKALPNRDAVYGKKAAYYIANRLNKLWDTTIATPIQYSSIGGYKIGIKNVNRAIEKEYTAQKHAESLFTRDINFYGGDQALMDQEEGVDDVLLQSRTSTASKASPTTIKLVKEFLERAGIDYKVVNGLVLNGKKIDANGMANITKSLISVVEGKEASTLPEEAMHFVVELIQQNNPALFKRLLKEINSYSLLNQVYLSYSNSPLYQTKEGKPDVLKLKKEAIGQVLSETLIKKTEGTIENPELLNRTYTWWRKILEWLKSLVIKSGFDQATLNIITGKDLGQAKALIKHNAVDNIYLSNTRRDDLFNALVTMNKSITPPDPEVEGDKYTIGDHKIKRRVSDLVYNWYEDKFKEKQLTQSEFTKNIYDLKAENGTLGHEDMEYFYDIFVDENGFLRDVPKDDARTTLSMGVQDVDAYNILKENFHNRLLSYGKNTRFLTETRIYDSERDIAGTVDFIAIQEDGTVNILDWKFMDLNIDKWDDVPWYKVNAWNTQMKQYKYIINRMHGVKNEEFGHTRMIPIKTHYSHGNAKEGILPSLLSIEIGDVNVKNITEDYLLPVGVENEKTGSKRINNLLEKLNKIYSRMSDRKVLPGQKADKREQLNSLYTAIRKLQIQQEIVPLINQAKVLNVQIDRIKQKFIDVFAKKDENGKPIKNEQEGYETVKPDQFTEEVISDFAKSLGDSIEYLEAYVNLDAELADIVDLSTEEGKELYKELKSVISEVKINLLSLKEMDTAYTQGIIGESVNIFNLAKPEKVIKGISRIFGTTGTLQMKSLQVLYKKANKAFGFSAMETRTEINKLNTLKLAYTKWANGKGLNKSNMFKYIMKEDKNQLIDEFDSEFYKTLRQKREEKDTKWIKENIDVKAYKEHLKEKLKEEITRIESKARIDTPEKNDFYIKKETSDAKQLYNISSIDSLGWLLDDVKKFPLREKWESKEWKELNKEENKPALDFYNYIRERNEYFAEIGYLNSVAARTFLPWVRKGLTEKLIFGGKLSVGEQFLRNITLDERETEFGQIDPLTGRPVDTVPIMLTTEIEGEYSRDLFKTMGLYNEFAIKFMYIKQIEEQIRAIQRLERNKGSLATSFTGRTLYKDGDTVPVADNSKNYNLLEDMIKAIIYQQRYIASETFDTVLGKMGSGIKKINKKLGFKLIPENLEGRTFSVNKSISHLNNTYQMVVLGWNPLSSLSNLFGGKSQGYINSGRYFTKTDYVKTETWLLANKMGNSNKQLHLAAIEYFMPFTDNFNREAINKLSLSKLSQESFQDYLMYLMRNSDRAVQVTNFFAFLKNSIVVGDKVVNAREHVRTFKEFENMYEGTEAERKEKRNKFDKEVEKLLEEKAVLKLASVNENGDFVIPGVERKSDSVIELRRKVQQFTNDALGNATEENKRLINLTVYGNSVMVFKNWIPRLVDVRTGNLKYNVASDAYEWGRSRMFFRLLYEDFFGSLMNLRSIVTGGDKGIEMIKKLHEKKRFEYQKDTGKKLDMTESMFIDLVRQNVENQLYDTLFYATLFSLNAGLKALAPDDEESEAVKNQWRFLVKATDKLTDELGYFYNPANIFSLIQRGIFPTTTLIDNYLKVLTNFMKEMYGIVIQDDQLVEDTQVIKYIMKSFPILNQSAAVLPMFAPNVAKDLEIRMQSNYGRR